VNRFAILFVLGLVVLAGAQAQQFAKTGVVNLSRVSQAYLDPIKVASQKDIDKMKDEIRVLLDQRATAAAKNDSAQVQTLDAQIQAKKDALTDFAKKKQAEWATAVDGLKTDATFQKLLPQEIEQSAISKGFALILNSSNVAVVWYGPDADITDDVIQRLQADLTK
jgi:Skp family chaperone for outer membrane proteins